MARLLRRLAPQLTVSLAFIHACAVQQFLQTWYSAASLIDLTGVSNNVSFFVHDSVLIAIYLSGVSNLRHAGKNTHYCFSNYGFNRGLKLPEFLCKSSIGFSNHRLNRGLKH